MTYTIITIGETSFDWTVRFTGLLELEVAKVLPFLYMEGYSEVSIDVTEDNAEREELLFVDEDGEEFQTRYLEGKSVLYGIDEHGNRWDSGLLTLGEVQEGLRRETLRVHWAKKEKSG